MRLVLLLFTSLRSWIPSLIPAERVRTGGWPRICAELFSNLWVVPRADGIRYMRFISECIKVKMKSPFVLWHLESGQIHRALIMWCRHLESLNFWIILIFHHVSQMMQPVLCETLDDSQTLKGNKFHFPAIPWSCTAKNVQLAVSRFAFCCNVILFLTGESSQLSLIGVLMVLCQSPCAQPRAKKLRESFEFNTSVNHRGNDKTWWTTVGCAAGPMQHLQKTQVCVQNFGFLLLQVHMSNPAAFA